MPTVRFSNRIAPSLRCAAVTLLAACVPITTMTIPASAQPAHAAVPTHWWGPSVERALADSGANHSNLTAALQGVPAGEREGLGFLIENMPVADLRTLNATYLLDTVHLAYSAWTAAPWAAGVPRDIFLNEILPYGSLNEGRDNSRALLRAKCLPLIVGCKTAG